MSKPELNDFDVEQLLRALEAVVEIQATALGPIVWRMVGKKWGNPLSRKSCRPRSRLCTAHCRQGHDKIVHFTLAMQTAKYMTLLHYARWSQPYGGDNHFSRFNLKFHKYNYPETTSAPTAIYSSSITLLSMLNA
jgi:hypothetical protein